MKRILFIVTAIIILISCKTIEAVQPDFSSQEIPLSELKSSTITVPITINLKTSVRLI